MLFDRDREIAKRIKLESYRPGIVDLWVLAFELPAAVFDQRLGNDLGKAFYSNRGNMPRHITQVGTHHRKSGIAACPTGLGTVCQGKTGV